MLYNSFKLALSLLGIICFWKYKFFILDNQKTESRYNTKTEIGDNNGYGIDDNDANNEDLTKLMLKQKSKDFEKHIESIVNVMQSFSKNTVDYYKN